MLKRQQHTNDSEAIQELRRPIPKTGSGRTASRGLCECELRQGQESNSFSLHGKMGQPGLAFHSASLFKFSRLAAIGAQYKNKKTGLQRALKM